MLKDVMVSDGLNVVRTDNEGAYSLSGHEKARFVFITTPSGFQTSNGYFQRITSEKREYDFGLQPYNRDRLSDGSHLFLHVTDTEISSSVGQDVWLNNIRDYAHNEQASFIIHTGDICYEKGLKSHLAMMNTDNMGIPVFYCIGNHDLVKGKYGEELYESIYGPVYYSFDVGNVHYVVTPMLEGDYHPGYTQEDVCRWLRNDLALIPKGTPIIFFNHDILTTSDELIYGASGRYPINLDDYNLKAWIYGHYHINLIRKHTNAYSICTSSPSRGGIDHSAAAFRVMRIDGQGNWSSELRYTYIENSLQIASIQNGKATLTATGKVPLSVNAYSTDCPIIRIRYCCQVNGKTILSQKDLVQRTDFNWYGEIFLPAALRREHITVEVEASYANGEKAIVRQSFDYPEIQSLLLSDNWTNLLGNSQHVGISKDTLKTPLSLVWIKNVGSNIYMSSPVIYNNRVYVATVDENADGKAGVISLDAMTGDISWRYSTRSSVKNTIGIVDGKVLAQDIEGYLYAIDVEEGKLIWELHLDVLKVPGLNNGLVVTDKLVYAGSGEGLCAVEVSTGKVLWKNTSWKQCEGTTTTLSLSNNVLIGSAQWGALYANDARTGKLLWKVAEEGIRHRASSPAIHGDMVYFISDRSLFVLSLMTGHILKKKRLPYSVDVTSTPLVTGNEIIFGSARNGIIALDRATLNEKWNYITGDALIYTSPYTSRPSSQIECSPVLSGDLILLGALDGVFYAIDRSTGELCWRYSVGAPVMSTVAVSGNTMFGTDFAGNVYAFKSGE